MSINSTSLAVMINRMNRYTSISTIDDSFKVQDLDEGIRTLKRNLMLPWTLQKSSLRVFDSVLEYPISDDYEHIAYVDNPPATAPLQPWSTQGERAMLHYTSLQQFYENSKDGNLMAEIWNGNVRYIGIRYNGFNNGSSLLKDSNTLNGWSSSDVALLGNASLLGDALPVETGIRFGPEADGSWKEVVDGADLKIKKMEAGTWNDKETITP